MSSRPSAAAHSVAGSLKPFLRLRKDELTLGEMLDRVESDDGPGPLLFVLTLPVLLPLPPGFSMVLALPLLLVALTLLFVVAVMVQTSINGREPLGEEFVLRLLFAGVAGEAGERPLDMGNGKSFWQSLMGFRGWKGRREQRAGAQEVEEVQIQMKTNEDGRWRLLKL